MCCKRAASTKFVATLACLACHCALVIAVLCKLVLHSLVCSLLDCETIEHGLHVLGRLGWLYARLALCTLFKLECASMRATTIGAAVWGCMCSHLVIVWCAIRR